VLFRFPDWTARLESFLAANRTRKFQYGSWDCCLFAADCILAITGIDIAEQFRGRYISRKEALRVVREITGRSSIEAAAEHCAEAHGMPEIEPLRAARGDMVLIPRPHDFSLGIVALNGMQILIVGKQAIGPIQFDRACRAWRV